MPEFDRIGWIKLAVVAAVVFVALALRTARLERRPVHCDEANQAAKLGVLLEGGGYHYDPRDHHGPTLYYLTLPLARLQSGGSFAATEIWVYRAVPVAFGVLLVALTLCAGGALGRGAATVAALLTAVSPAMVYFSRFYIQEMLLVTFTFCLLFCLWRCLCTASFAWAASAGASAGLMCATKETCVLAWAALVVAAGVHWVGHRRQMSTAWAALGWRHVAVMATVAAVIAVLFFSSFLTYWRGPLDALRAYGLFLDRGTGANSPHQHPFLFYLGILTPSRPAHGLAWGEEMILGLGLVGASAAWVWPKRLRGDLEAVRLLAVYTAVLTLIYSAIPYKTPWCLLSFWHGWILLAGVGAATLLRLPRQRWQRLLLAVLLAAGTAQLAQRAWRAASRYAAAARNPYVYAQTGTDFLRLVERINALSASDPAAKGLSVRVIAPPEQTWPLPWYLRRFTHVGYWTEPVAAALAAEPAVIVTTPEISDTIPADRLQRYVTEYYGLRPEVLLAMHIRTDLWDRFMRSRNAPTLQTSPAQGP